MLNNSESENLENNEMQNKQNQQNTKTLKGIISFYVEVESDNINNTIFDYADSIYYNLPDSEHFKVQKTEWFETTDQVDKLDKINNKNSSNLINRIISDSNEQKIVVVKDLMGVTRDVAIKTTQEVAKIIRNKIRENNKGKEA